MKALRLLLFAAGALGLAAAFVGAGRKLPPVGSYAGAYGEVLNAVALGERRATDVVSAVNFDYRGLDTLGEEFILFTSVLAVATILRRQEDEEDEEDEPKWEPRKAPESDAVRTLGGVLVPLMVSFGLYMISHGAVSPGGGFQGGLVLASAPLVVYLCATAKTFLRIAPPGLTRAGESIGAAGYVLIGCLGVLAGKTFLENVLPLGTPGNAWSSGTILFLNLTVGLAVAAGFTELLSVFVEEVLRREA
ncbi:MAG TPA: MnhB domain-containing protein [Myxococcales bacterium]|nr:MnhB domain-containing protein [Myxococcales bacterium]